MKATIAGITYEGTCEEIKAIVDRMTPRMGHDPYMPADWLVRYPDQHNVRTFTTTGDTFHVWV